MKKINGIRYSMSWEDPSFLLESIKPGDQVLMVGSGGCLPLSSFVKSPSRVQVTDINPDQIRLIRLKQKAFQSLDYNECMEFLGCFEKRKFQKKRLSTFSKLAPRLPAVEVKHWELDLDKIARGIIHEGRYEKYLRFFSARLLPLCSSKSAISNFLNSQSLTVQKEVYKTQIDTKRYRLLFKWFFGKLIMKNLGRHPNLLKHVKESTGDIFYRRMERAWHELTIKENYFFRYIIEGYFDPELTLPTWLNPKYFQEIKTGLDKLHFSQGNMIDLLSSTRENSWNLIYLSNITETMSEEEAQKLFELCYRALKPKGKMIIWNNLVDRKPQSGFDYLKLSDKLWSDRIDAMYGFAGIYQRND